MFGRVDMLLLGLIGLLSSFGLMLLYGIDGDADLLSQGDGSFERQFQYFIFGLVIFFLTSQLKQRRLYSFLPWLYGAGIFALLVALFFGPTIAGTNRWLVLGGVTIQPAEFMKPLLIGMSAQLLAKRSRYAYGYHYIFNTALLFAPPIVLVLLQPDLGSALLLLILAGGMIMISGVKWRYLMSMSISVLLALPFLWVLLAPYQQDRVITFLDPTSDPQGNGYNTIQAITALGSGGIEGQGLGQGTQSQLNFLPVRHTDFIFSVAGEELGLIGVVLLFTLLLALSYRLVYLSAKVDSARGRLVILGASVLLLAQASINIGVNMGLLPVTGLPLPFVSYGGSSLISTMLLLGLVQNEANQARQKEQSVEVIRSFSQPIFHYQKQVSKG